MQPVEAPPTPPEPAIRSDLATALRTSLRPLGDEIVVAIRAAVPDYSQPLEGSFGIAVQTGVEEALKRFVDVLEQGGGAEGSESWRRVYTGLGRAEAQQGRTLEGLLAAYRVGARVSWRRMAEAARAAGADEQELTILAEAMFAYIDELSSISAEGYAAEQATMAGETQRLRERVVRLLVDGASEEAIEGAAAHAGWTIPHRAAVMVVRHDTPAALAGRLGGGAIAARLPDDVVCVVVPGDDPPVRVGPLSAALRGAPAALGPAVAVSDLPRSLARARGALALRDRGLIGDASPVVAGEHLAAMVLHNDPALLAEHADAALAALDELPAGTRARLLETLAAWLDHPAQPTEVGRVVHVHPQTVRYRLRRLRELLGDIDSPERRFELALAVRARTPGGTRPTASASV